MPITKKSLCWLLLVAGAVAAGSVSLLRPPPFQGPVAAFAPGIASPDALIRTHSLSKLPPDLLKVPLARDVLTEDFVAYYEQNEDRLALSGTVRRIAYEHKLDLPGRLVESIFDEPAEVALWRGGDGRLQHFMVVMTRNVLARVIQTALPVVSGAADMQLSSVGRLDGADVDILALRYGRNRRLLLLAKGDRVVALSDPGMLLEKHEENKQWRQKETAAKLIRELLDGQDAVSPFARRFRIDRPLSADSHEISLGARAFLLGYEAFAPGLEALKLSFDGKGEWQSAALIDDDAPLDAGALWAALPHGPSLCAALPAGWAKLAFVLDSFNADPKAPANPDGVDGVNGVNGVATGLAGRFTGAVAVCWYEASRLYTPLFAARLASNADEKQAEEFFALAAAATQTGAVEASFDAGTGVGLWQGEAPSRFGSADSSGLRKLKPALALRRDVVFFSPDASLVKTALDVAAKRYPAIADRFAGGDANTLAVIDPDALAALLRRETFAALSRDEEALFRNAADAYLAPRFDALARYPAQRVKLMRGRSRDWRALAWEEQAGGGR
ncbi:MAG: DUF2138 family protein [Candidatus Accumulibacter sp.]|jgi:uncharacterized protein YfaA (DUF2138 family)|nr:DUF2138 family protein [Accumulibacter sp.]